MEQNWFQYVKTYGYLPEKVEGENHDINIDLTDDVEDTLVELEDNPQTIF